MTITDKTRSVELFRLMWETERDTVPMKPDQWSDLQRAAHEEWDRRLEMAEHEYGSGASRGKARRYDAYCQGREDERQGVSAADLIRTWARY